MIVHFLELFREWKKGKKQAKSAFGLSTLTSPRNKLIDDLIKWRAIGQSFTYLGRECIVTAHHQFESYGFGGIIIPAITANYVDNDGIIRSITFKTAESIALINQTPPAAK